MGTVCIFKLPRACACSSTEASELVLSYIDQPRGVDAIRRAFREVRDETKAYEWMCFNDLLDVYTENIEIALLEGFNAMFPNASAAEV